MKLTFSKPYISIVGFPEITLPNFSLITGLNGSGKTHLLQALDKGHIKIDGVNNPSQEVRYFDWASFIPQNQANFQSQQLSQERAPYLQLLSQLIPRFNNTITSKVVQAGFPADQINSLDALSKLNIEDIQKITDTEQQAQNILENIQVAFTNADNQLKQQLRNQPQYLANLQAFERTSQRPLTTYSPQEIVDEVPVTWGSVDVFQQSFARLFVIYRDAYLANQLKVLAQNNGDKKVRPLSEDEFIQKYNIPPWKFLNQSFSDANLDFEVNHPPLYEFGAFTPQLTKKSSNAVLNFTNLSSGEKILMSFANCLYYARDQRQVTTFPKVLLLDEVDAPLHPSMSRSLIKSITNTLVEQFNITVIATTHSPSTVAMAPEDSIHIMQGQFEGLVKASKNQALSLLTSGVPSLAISYSGRRQVFVESDNDVQVYDKVYQLLKSQLETERSLTFMSTGLRTESGDVGTGCDQVKRFVKMFEESENDSIYGLIDWDGKADPIGRVKILAHEKRDGLENCIFDPLVIAFAIARDARDRRGSIGLSEAGGFLEAKHFSSDKLQTLSLAVQTFILGEAVDLNNCETCSYVGGLELLVSKAYTTMDDHALETLITQKIPQFNNFNRRAGGLMVHIVQNILPDVPEFIPQVFFDIFDELLS